MPSSTTLIPLPEQRIVVSTLRRWTTPVRSGKGRLLYLVGPAGCGKSALLRQFVHQMDVAGSILKFENSASDTSASSANRVVVSVTASEFAAELAEASDRRIVHEFQAKYRAASLLICEDIHALSGRMESLLQLLAVVDELVSHGQDVIVTSTKLPGQLDRFPMKLVNRFRGGTLISIPLPGPDSRAALLRHFAANEPLALPRDCVALLAEALPMSARELAGIVTQLAALKRPIRRELIDDFLNRQVAATSITPQAVTQAVAREFGVTQAALRSSRRAAALVLPRQLAMWLCRNVCQMSLPAIGDHFRRQHSSVLHSVRKFEERLKNEPKLRLHLTKVKSTLK